MNLTRDLIGYGANPPNPNWPGQARLALNFVLNFEEGSEPSVPDGDGHELASHPAPLWAPAVDAFLASLGPPWNAATAPRPVLRLDPG